MLPFLLADLSLAAVTAKPEPSADLATTLTICLLGATLVALISRRFRIPYVTGLVLAGLTITNLLPRRLGIDSGLILNLFLPILVFQAAINTDISRLRSSFAPISVLAGPGILLATGVTASVLKFGLNLDWIPALLVGSILAITDTVSVIAVFREIAVPSRLTTIVEGESLFNDGVALVIFGLIVELQAGEQVTAISAVQSFFLVVLGGGLLGLATGYLASGLFRTLADDSLSGILLTVAVAFGTFQLGEALNVSGVVAVVVAGLTVGNLALDRAQSPSSRLTLINFWEYAAFCVNTFIFLFIGVEVDPRSLLQTLPAVLLAIVAYQLARLVTVYPLMALVNRFDRPIPFRWQHVLFLGNIKGSLSMVLALSLPATLGNRSELVNLVFGVVLLSLVVQGLSLPWFVKRLKVATRSTRSQEAEQLQAQLIAGKAVQSELLNLYDAGVLPKAVHEELRARYQLAIAGAEQSLRGLYNRRSTNLRNSAAPAFSSLQRRLLLVEKNALLDSARKGILTEEAIADRLQVIDAELLRAEAD
ncbi:cation:proton antiporter [Synechococcus elongatus]|uniref:cation:proton antiporter n=1 Tax=Synechococcus elongatus TaxID=32046 RepID=UPI00003A00DF|nr:sodium:proton antiporter [Synechococcus elongatus]